MTLDDTTREAKEEIFILVCNWTEHERTCDDCSGEVDGRSLESAYRYLCDEGKRMLKWFVDPAI